MAQGEAAQRGKARARAAGACGLATAGTRHPGAAPRAATAVASRNPELVSDRRAAKSSQGAHMSDQIPFTYGEFHDFPRMIRFWFKGECFFLSSSFDEDKDDYPDFYVVYRLPFRSEKEVRSNPDYWRDLGTADRLGQIPIQELGLDETRRQSIDAGRFENWLSAQNTREGR
jgi:hypothetical protein